MGMIGGFKRITAAELEAIIDDPSGVESLVYPETGEPGNEIDIDKAWHGLHFLLTGDSYAGSGPLAQAILGGIELGGDLGYGPGRYLTVAEVVEVSAALSALSTGELTARFDVQQLMDNDIYPQIWNEGDPALDYLLDAYQAVCRYYASAAESGEAMLKYIQ